MYDLIEAIIDHSYNTQYSGDQQYIYYACIVLICLFSTVVIDLFYRFVKNIFGGKT